MKKVNINNIPWIERKSPKGKFHRFRRDVALAFENPKTGRRFPAQAPFEVELIRMPPGATNFPLHSHATEWEFYLILSGTGKMRAGKKTVSVAPGDCIMNPPGEAHQIVNTGTDDLTYYVIANNAGPYFFHIPVSNKWGVSFRDVTCTMIRVDYYEGEE